jgi:hypothetical protein
LVTIAMLVIRRILRSMPPMSVLLRTVIWPLFRSMAEVRVWLILL